MLYLHQSNQLETLASVLATIHAKVPLSGAFTPEHIVVQSQGMRRYINRFLAQENGIAANLQFSLPAGFSWKLMQQVIPNLSALNPFSPQVLQWRLVEILQSQALEQEKPAAWAQLQPYLSSSANALYDLSGQLADIFDQYLVYRPHWLDAWQNGDLLDLGKDEAWQQALWQMIANDGHAHIPHRAKLWQDLLSNINVSHLPERISIFGIAAMAPMYVELFQAIAKHVDIHIFALNPCHDYWYQLLEPEQILQRGLDETLDNSIEMQVGHPLLASLGKQGRDFLNTLTSESDLAYSSELFQEPSQASLLGQLQSDILNLRTPEKNSDGQAALLDHSIEIHSTHSPLRELQILKDSLLDMLGKNPDWQAHDIAVLTPDIEPYTPFIESIFGEYAPDGVRIPYSVADVKISQKQPYLSGIESLLSILQSRFEITAVLPLFDNPCVLKRFDLTLDDIPTLQAALEDLNIHWGLDQNMRGQYGANSECFTWSQGLERMALGLMLPSNGNTDATWQEKAPLKSALEQLPVFSQWLSLWQTLSHYHALFQTETDVSGWVERLQNLAQDFLLAEETDTSAATSWSQALADWQAEVTCSHFQAALAFHTVAKHVSNFLSSSSEAGFLRQGVTFCSMIPMRSLPFKVICLLGLNDGKFPRNFSKPEFDLINQHPERGDRSHRDDDRYLFLESIISARDVLYLSFLGKSQDKNEDMAASPLLHELVDVIATMTGSTGKSLWENWIVQHPLQAFSKQYYTPNASLHSYRQDYAQALNQAKPESKAFLASSAQDIAEHTSCHDKQQVHISDFIAFWKNPVRHWLQNQLGWKSQYLQASLDDTEPFDAAGNAQVIYEEYFQARRDNISYQDTVTHLAAKNMWPDGHLAEHWQNQYQKNIAHLPQTWFSNERLPALSIHFEHQHLTLTGSLKNLYNNGLVTYQSQKANNTDEVGILLEHLIWCASSRDAQQSLWVWPPEPKALQTIPQDTAQALLKKCLGYWQAGQHRPLPFFARTSLSMAKAWHKECEKHQITADELNQDSHEKVQKAARDPYLGNKMSKGQKDYPEVKLVFGEIPSRELLEQADFIEPIREIWLPLQTYWQDADTDTPTKSDEE